MKTQKRTQKVFPEEHTRTPDSDPPQWSSECFILTVTDNDMKPAAPPRCADVGDKCFLTTGRPGESVESLTMR